VAANDDLDGPAVERVLAGDLDAFEEIVARWQRPLINLAFRFCRDRSRAEDLAQEAFLKAYRSLASFRGEASFSTWLMAVAINLFRSSLRRQEPSIVGLEAVAAAAGELLGAAMMLERRDLERTVRAAVAGLPARYRDALVLFYFLDMNVEAAASVLGVPSGTLKARLHRGRNLLRKRVTKHGEALAPGAPCAEEA
jgi:RNA polymerase sigma-70 factor, ECF subfamily